MSTFWEIKSLGELTDQEWESLCDGCGLCCLHKIKDKTTGKIYYTYVACKLLDIDTCQCTSYKQRQGIISECLEIIPNNFSRMHMLPETCAYRRISERKSLLWWHPLISQNPNTVHEAGISVRGKVIPEQDIAVNDIPKFIMEEEEN